MFATFSPLGNKVAFVRANNLFIKDIESGNEIQVTSDGKNNEIKMAGLIGFMKRNLAKPIILNGMKMEVN